LKNFKRVAAAEAALKSPESAFFKGGISSVGLKPLFGKTCPESFGSAQDKLRRREGKGRFLAQRRGNYVANF
jgi:hypothetical protein